MAKYYWRFAAGEAVGGAVTVVAEDVKLGGVTCVGEVDEHAHPIHLVHYALAERGEAVVDYWGDFDRF